MIQLLFFFQFLLRESTIGKECKEYLRNVPNNVENIIYFSDILAPLSNKNCNISALFD